MLAVALLLGGASGDRILPQQDTNSGSNSAAQAPASPPTEKSETPPAAPNPPTVQKETLQKPEAKKGSPCAGKRRSAKGKCGKRRTGEARRIVIREGSTQEPTAQLVPGMSPEEARHQREKTEELLNSTETNLRQLAGRAFDRNQQDTIGQVRHYMAGARSALQNGDLPRARNLAFKAHLLSDDLVKH